MGGVLNYMSDKDVEKKLDSLNVLKMTSSFEGKIISGLELKYNLVFPKFYKEYLKMYGTLEFKEKGGYLEVLVEKERTTEYVVVLNFLGLTNKSYDLKEMLDMYQERLPAKLIPIALVDGGDLFCLCTDTGFIYLWSHDREYTEPLNEAMVWEPLRKTHKNLKDLLLSLVIVLEGSEPQKDDGILSVQYSEKLLELIRETRFKK